MQTGIVSLLQGVDAQVIPPSTDPEIVIDGSLAQAPSGSP